MSGPDKPRLSIVIPVYDEEAGLPTLFARLRELSPSLPDVEVEILFVDDHSSDRSPELLREACDQTDGFRFIRLSANCGSHTAVYAGLANCVGDCAVFLAADLQDPPELIPEMLVAWRGGAEIVWAVRTEREGVSWLDRALGRAFHGLFNRLSHTSIPPQGSDFVLMGRPVLEALKQSVTATPYLMGEIARLGFDQARISYTKQARQQGTTKWTLGRKLRLFADAFVANSYVPLRAMSYFGMISSLLGFAYVVLILVLRLVWGTPVQGWSSLMVVVLFLGGIQMTMLGVLGEYLWRTLEAARRRPLFFLEEPRRTDAAQRSGRFASHSTDAVRATKVPEEVESPR